MQNKGQTQSSHYSPHTSHGKGQGCSGASVELRFNSVNFDLHVRNVKKKIKRKYVNKALAYTNLRCSALSEKYVNQALASI